MQKNIIRDGCVLGDKGKSLNLFKMFLLPSVLLFLVMTAGCNKKPEYIPGQTVQGIRAPISKVLFSPMAFDGAVLKIEGHITDLIVEGQIEDGDAPSGVPEITDADPDDLTTLFKLIDTRGNYINIILPGTWDIVDDDYIVVGGTYRKNGNELHAREFEVVEFEEEKKEEEIQKRDDW